MRQPAQNQTACPRIDPDRDDPQPNDANRRKAQMALLGVRSDIKRGQANKRTVYRVYTDPMEDPEEVNHVSEQLQQANIEILLKRVSD